MSTSCSPRSSTAGREFFENGAAAFEQKRPTNHSTDQERIAYLEKKIQTKDEVLAELMAEHVALKKRLGNSDRVCLQFYHLCSILDGFSRYIVNWDIRESMTEADIEIILQAAKEKYPEARPRIISDNGPQFIAKDFKEFIRISGMTHVRASPFYPQSNGKIERRHKSLKGECIRPGTPLSLDNVRRLVSGYVDHYNNAG
jgi:transposase InsO family protein